MHRPHRNAPVVIGEVIPAAATISDIIARTEKKIKCYGKGKRIFVETVPKSGVPVLLK